MAAHRIVVATHGHCFDGMASAALYSHLMRHVRKGRSLAFRYVSCGYGPNMSHVPETWLDGDENAILDFKYTPSTKLTWYFDHHATAFTTDDERAEALAGASGRPGEGRQVYFDAKYGSCTKLIADTAARIFGVHMDHLRELVEWAEVIDTAGFATAADAVRRDEPVLQLSSVVEQHGDRAFLDAIIPKLLTRSLYDVAKDPWVTQLWEPIDKARAVIVERVRTRSTITGRVVLTDLTDAPNETAAKFVSYALFPECMYSVTLSRAGKHLKMAVGYNPWCGIPRDHNIGSICKRFGGGGHAVVGAATFRNSDEEAARAAALSVVRELCE
ncbi:MAG: hypothetical protein IPK82_32205 [Polyangiaceae bacterium]|nr:hypothetical protein [Polyangiaceae bacterium]